MIKRAYFVIFLSLAFSFVCFGQTSTSEVKIPSLDENWQKFSLFEEEFSAETPTKLLPGYIDLATATTTKSRIYKGVVGNTYYYIFSDDLKTPWLNETAFRFAGSAADQNQQNVIFKFADRYGHYYRILSIKTPKRVYTIQIVSLTANDSQSDRFFAGIKINSQKPELTESVAANSERKIVELTKTEARNNSPGGNSTGIGLGNGVGTGSTIPNSGNAPSSTPATPLKILTKPKAIYPLFARLCEYEGKVRLKIAFQANGEIGQITPTLSLPFGLTEEAIEAARQLKFVPAAINGKPVTVVKSVEYVFSIF